MVLVGPRFPQQLDPMTASGPSWCDDHAADDVSVYEATDPAALHAWLDGIPPGSCLSASSR